MLVVVFASCLALPAAAADRFQVVPLQTQTEVIGKNRIDSFEAAVLDTRTAKANICIAGRDRGNPAGAVPSRAGAADWSAAGPPSDGVPSSNLIDRHHRLVVPALDQALWQVDPNTGDVTLCVLLRRSADGMPDARLVCSSAKFK